MRARDSSAAIRDAIDAGHWIHRFLGDCTLDHYLDDRLLRSAVERQFEIIGEALGRALRADASLSERLPEAQSVIGFRNILAHGYDAVVDGTVYDLAREDLPDLVKQLEALSREQE